MTVETFHAGPNLGQLSDVTIIHGDCIEAMRELADNSVDAVVCDPPYGISFMGKEWDQPGANGSQRKGGSDRSFKAGPVGVDHLKTTERSASMHAGKYDLSLTTMQSFGRWCEQWTAEAIRVLKPGGHLLAFGGTRTWHRLAVAVEDAGFEIRDSIAWLYGSGFPKSLDVGKAIDKTDAAVARLTRAREFQSWLSQHLTPKQVDEATSTNMGYHYTTHPTQPSVVTVAHLDLLRPLLPDVPHWVEEMAQQRTVESENYNRRPMANHESRPGMAQSWTDGSGWNGSTARGGSAITPEAEQWQGWGTALKPAFEPVVVGRKPFKGNVAQNVLTHGTGALNIDGTRITSAEDDDARRVRVGGFSDSPIYGTGAAGRWPANVILDSSQAAALDEQSGTLTTGAHLTHHVFKGSENSSMSGKNYERSPRVSTPADAGGASRFFLTAESDPKPDKMNAWSRSRADSVARYFATIRATIESSAPTSVAASPSVPSDLRARCAEALAGLEETSIAHDLVAIRTLNSGKELLHSLASMADSSDSIPILSLAYVVEQWDSTDTIPTTTSLTRLFGCAIRAIDENTNSGSLGSVSGISLIPSRFRYNAKAPKKERPVTDDGTAHPTVKPLALMRWLVRLVTPPGGVVLDPFAGSGTTVEAALLEGFKVVGIEREADYLPMIQQRIARCLNS